MANYKEIQGFPIQNLSSDPVPYAQELINNPYAGTWASGGSLNTARSEVSSGGIQTSSIVAGGRTPSPLIVNNAEIYDGSTWTAIATINTTRRAAMGAATVNTAAIIYGGPNQASPPFSASVFTESWNGSSWTEVGDLNTGKSSSYGSMGSSTAAISVQTTTCETWNGTSWTEVNDLNTSRGNTAFFGTSTSSVLATGTQTTNSESWDGSSWTAISAANQAREAGAGSGTDNTAGIIFGGNYDPVGYLTKTEDWNGSAWTEVNDLSTARLAGAGSGSETLGLFSGGTTPGGSSSATEEWAFTGLPPSTPAAGYSDAIIGQMYYNSTTGQFKAIEGDLTGSWSSGGSLNIARYQMGGAGISTTSGLAFGGFESPAIPASVKNESYDGTSFTEVGDLNAGNRYITGCGTQTAALSTGGLTSPTAKNEQWDGSSWTEVGDLNEGRYDSAQFGTVTASLFANGQPPASPFETANVETWDGSSWTEVGNTNVAKYANRGFGSTTAGLIFGGATVSPSTLGTTESWNGTSWTEVADLNTARFRMGTTVSSPADDGQAMGGVSPGYTQTESWDGTSWTEIADMATGRGAGAGIGSSGSGVVAGGGTTTSSPTRVANTEEFVKVDFQIKTMTTS